MIETIKAVLENYKDANLESESCREKIAGEIEKKIKSSGYIPFLAHLWGATDIRKIKAWEKDNDN